MDVGTLPNHFKSCVLSCFLLLAIFINNCCRLLNKEYCGLHVLNPGVFLDFRNIDAPDVLCNYTRITVVLFVESIEGDLFLLKVQKLIYF